MGFLFLSSKCNKNNPENDDKLTLIKRTFTGDQLRLDGFYYRVYESDKDRLEIYFLFSNGLVLQAGGQYSYDLDNREITINMYNSARNYKFYWGL